MSANEEPFAYPQPQPASDDSASASTVSPPAPSPGGRRTRKPHFNRLARGLAYNKRPRATSQRPATGSNTAKQEPKMWREQRVAPCSGSMRQGNGEDQVLSAAKRPTHADGHIHRHAVAHAGCMHKGPSSLSANSACRTRAFSCGRHARTGMPREGGRRREPGRQPRPASCAARTPEDSAAPPGS